LKRWTEDLIALEAAHTLDGAFARRVVRSANREAYRWYERDRGWQSLTWAETADEVARWQQAMAAEGLQAGDRVALILRNSPQWVLFDQAALSLALVTVPLYTDDRPDNIAYILQDASVRLLLVQDAGRWNRLAPALTDNRWLERVLLLDADTGDVEALAGHDPRVRLVGDWLAPRGSIYESRQGDSNSLASIVYTSGTTGRPKGVMLSHRNMMWVSHAALDQMQVYQQDVFLSFLPLSHTLERSHGYYTPLMAGAAVVFARSVNQLAQDLVEQKPTLMISVPRIFERVYAKLSDKMAQGSPIKRGLFKSAVYVGWRKFEYEQGRSNWTFSLLLHPLLDRLVASKVRARLGGRLRASACGGAPLNSEIARVFIGLGIPLLQGYGLTESSPLISVNSLESNIPASVGPPLTGLEIKIGKMEELLVRGPNVMLGYWNNPGATADTIDQEGWLHTGDQVRIQQGHLFITGRLKDILVLSNGEKLPPSDMEMAIALDPLFEQVMVVGEGRPYLTALVVVNDEVWPAVANQLGLDGADAISLDNPAMVSEASKRIRTALKDFPGYAKVRRVKLLQDPWSIDNDLITPTLKIKRAKVLKQFAAEVDALYKTA
jgi:long-chain acyl-CoA synthetase